MPFLLPINSTKVLLAVKSLKWQWRPQTCKVFNRVYRTSGSCIKFWLPRLRMIVPNGPNSVFPLHTFLLFSCSVTKFGHFYHSSLSLLSGSVTRWFRVLDLRSTGNRFKSWSLHSNATAGKLFISTCLSPSPIIGTSQWSGQWCSVAGEVTVALVKVTAVYRRVYGYLRTD